MIMGYSLEQFRQEMFHVNYPARKDGCYADANRLTPADREIAENEMIEYIQDVDGDYWPVDGLAGMKSQKALPVLYKLLPEREGTMKIAIAAAIYTICEDKAMINIALDSMCVYKGLHWGQIIDNIHFARHFGSDSIKFVPLLEELCNHEEYLIVYNAKRVLNMIQCT